MGAAEEYIVRKLEFATSRIASLEKENMDLEIALKASIKVLDDIIEKMTLFGSDYFGESYRIEIGEISEKETPELFDVIKTFKEQNAKGEKNEGAD